MWADRPEGPWSDPIDIGVYGLFDPGHVADQQGNRYLYFNRGMMIRLAPDGLSAVGELKHVYDGWQYPKEWATSCLCLEAPKFLSRDGYYYYLSAEGGTDGPTTAHMEVVARSRSVEGPWENSPYNPLVHNTSTDSKWWRQGHGTIVPDEAGKWWFLYTGFENGYTVFGKQSLLLPIEWTDDGWPRVPAGVSATDILPKPAGENIGHGMPLSDNFSSSTLGIQWTYPPSTKPADVFKIGDGQLLMKASGAVHGNSMVAPADATTLAIVPVNHAYEAEVEITIPETAEAGLLLSSGGNPGGDRGGSLGAWASVGLHKGEVFRNGDHSDFVPSNQTHLFVKLRNMHYDITGYYSTDGKTWTQFDYATYVNDGRRLALYASGTGDVIFRNFKYHGID